MTDRPRFATGCDRRPSGRLERHYSLKEAAARLGVAPTTIQGWILRGFLPRIKMPGLRGKVLLRESDLRRFLDAHREEGVREVLARVQLMG